MARRPAGWRYARYSPDNRTLTRQAIFSLFREAVGVRPGVEFESTSLPRPIARAGVLAARRRPSIPSLV